MQRQSIDKRPVPDLSPCEENEFYDRGCFYCPEKTLMQVIDNAAMQIEQDPRNAKAWFQRGFARYAMVQLNPNPESRDLQAQAVWQDAKKDFEQAVKLDPQHADAWYFLAIFCRSRLTNHGLDTKKAIFHCNKAIKLNPRKPGYYFLRGVCHDEAGELDKAMADFNQSLPKKK